MAERTQPGALAALPLVMLPGTLCDERIFAPLRQRLVGFGTEVVLTPHARSLGQAAEQVLAQAPERFVLLGFSLGGMVAMEAALHAPDRVAALILMSTTPLAVPQSRHAARRGLVAQAQVLSMRGLVRDRLWVDYGGTPGDTGTLRLLEQMAEDLGADVFAAQTAAALARADVCHRLPAVRCPVLILAGDADAVCPPAAQQSLAAALPGSTMVMISGGSHFALLERADEVATFVAAWLHRQDFRCEMPTAAERA